MRKVLYMYYMMQSGFFIGLFSQACQKNIAYYLSDVQLKEYFN